MTIDIKQKRLNKEKLNKAIITYEDVNNHAPYLFMNIDTMKDLDVSLEHTDETLYDRDVYRATYWSQYGLCRVFDLEILPYGEVELR